MSPGTTALAHLRHAAAACLWRDGASCAFASATHEWIDAPHGVVARPLDGPVWTAYRHAGDGPRFVGLATSAAHAWALVAAAVAAGAAAAAPPDDVPAAAPTAARAA